MTNVLLHKPLIESLLFSLAIAVGITPQLLPAVVSTSLAVGTRRLARRKVLVKRLVCIEDLGDMDVLVTDKTGTLTEGRVTLAASMAPDGAAAEEPLLLGLLATEVDPASVGSAEAAGNPLDRALCEAPEAHRRPGRPLPAPGAVAVRPRAADDQRPRPAPGRGADDGHQGCAGGGGRPLP